MPFVSKAQQRWGNSPAGVKALGGPGKVQHWNESTETQAGGFKGLPQHVVKKKKGHARAAAARSLASRMGGKP